MSTGKYIIAATTTYIYVYAIVHMHTGNKDEFLNTMSFHFAYIEKPLLLDLQYQFHSSVLF